LDVSNDFLAQKANDLRKDVISMVYQAGDGHPGPALSIADIIATLYFKEMNIKPDQPRWPERDRLVLSKGHACPVVYAALAEKGFFAKELLPSLRKLNSSLEGHPNMKKTPGIDMTTGSLGNGLSIALGIALSGSILQKDFYVYAIIGDGELGEGLIWEGAMAAAHYHVGNLIVFIDHNGYQSGGKLKDISGINGLIAKWESFGWHCQEINGHHFQEITEAIQRAKNEREQPSIIIANTIKGKGVPFMENDNSWHKRTPTREEFEQAMACLGGEQNEK